MENTTDNTGTGAAGTTPTPMQPVPTDAQTAVQAALDAEKQECWQAVNDVLAKYQYSLTPTTVINVKGINFIIDIIKIPAK